MSGKVRQKTSANAADLSTQSINEKILKECHNVYTEPDNGLVRIAESLGVTLLAPRKKITVLLIGNHSAGKSSFINWIVADTLTYGTPYANRVDPDETAPAGAVSSGSTLFANTSNNVTMRYVEEHVQRTGVAIETQGFTFVTSGRKRESLTGNATLHLYPHFEPLRQIEGVTDYLQTEISTSKQKKFSLVTFVDTPGLVDGDMKYPFDVNQSILWLGDLADLIFVFFDPIGQALCKRTLNIVEILSQKHAERMKFYLSKADEAGMESDRQRVMMQIVQELCKRPGLNRTGFDMPTIYVPNMNQKGSRCVNQIEEVCKEIEKTINQTIQTTLNSLERDCDLIATTVEDKLANDSATSSANLKSQMRGATYGMLGMMIPLLLLATFLISTQQKLLKSFIGDEFVEKMALYLGPLATAWSSIPSEYTMYVLFSFLGMALLMLLLAKFASRTKPTLSRKQRRNMLEMKDYVQSIIKTKKQNLYSEYLKQSVAEHDL